MKSLSDKKKILITGAAGFLGKSSVKMFLKLGWHVTALIHKNKLEDLPKNNLLEIIQCSLDDKKKLEEIFSQSQFDVILNCAARATDIGRKKEFYKCNFINMIDCIKKYNVKRLIHISSTDVYGVKNFHNADETTPLCNNKNNLYPEYKIFTEHLIRKHLSKDKYVILRPAALWGPDDTTLLPRILNFLKYNSYIVHFGKNKGRNIRHLSYIENVLNMIYVSSISDIDLGETYNVVDKEKTSIDDYYQIIIDLFFPQKKIKRIIIPFFIGWILGFISSSLANIFNRKKPFFDPTLYGLYHVSKNLDFNHKKAETLLKQNGIKLIDHEISIHKYKTFISKKLNIITK